MVKKFLLHLLMEKNLSQNTVNSYKTDIEQFLEYAGKGILDVQSDDISRFIIHLKEQGYSTASTNRKLSAIKTFFRYLVRQHVIDFSPAAEIEGGKKEQYIPQIVDEEDIEHIIAASDNLRDKVVIEILYGAGIRRAELCRIKIADINFSKGCIRIFGKGNKERIVPIDPATLDTVKQFISSQPGPYLLPGKKENSPISVRTVNRIIEKYVKKLHLQGKNITPHKFRHACLSALFNNGADIKVVQDIAGHASINTTNIYAKTSVDRNLKEYRQYHPRMKVART